MDLEIRKEINGTALTMVLNGMLNKITMNIFDEEFRAASEGMKEVILDFSGVNYLSSAGLRSLLQATKQMEQQGGALMVLHPQEAVMDVFEMTKFSRFIRIVREGEEPAEGEPSLQEYYPLRPIQRWMADAHFWKAKSTMLNTGALIRLDPSIDMERLAEAMNDLLATYDIFRCRLVFHPETGDLCQRFDGEVERVYVESMSEELLEARKQELKQPYDIIDHPLHRVHLMKTASAQYLYVDFYHVIMDGTAIVLLFWRELEKRYVNGINQKAKRQPASYADYVLEESRIPAEELAEGQAYWRKMLEGFDEKKHLPPMDGGNPADGPEHEMELPIQGIEKHFFKGKEFSENTFFMAASMLATAKLTGVKESILSWVHNGRVTSAERRLMGLMLDQFPLRWDFDRDLPAGEFLKALEERVKEGMKYRKSLGSIYEDCLEDNCASFILQKGSMGRRGSMKFGDTMATIEEMPANEISAAENILDIELNAHDDGTYSLVLNRDTNRFSNAAMKRYYQTVVEMVEALQDESRMILELLKV